MLRARFQRVVVDRVDDHGRPHLIDRRVEQNEEKNERHDRQCQRSERSQHRVEWRIHGRERHQRIKSDPDEEPEIELIVPAPQELVKDLGRKCACCLLQRQQQGDGDGCDGDEASSDGFKKAGSGLGVREDISLERSMQSSQRRELRPLECVHRYSKQEKTDDDKRR